MTLKSDSMTMKLHVCIPTNCLLACANSRTPHVPPGNISLCTQQSIKFISEKTSVGNPHLSYSLQCHNQVLNLYQATNLCRALKRFRYLLSCLITACVYIQFRISNTFSQRDAFPSTQSSFLEHGSTNPPFVRRFL